MGLMLALSGSYSALSLLLVVLEAAAPLSLLGYLFEKAAGRFGERYAQFAYWAVAFPLYRVIVDGFELLRTAYLPAYYGNPLALLVFLALQSLVGAMFGVVFTVVYLMIYNIVKRRE